MPFKPLTKSKYPRRLWSLVGYPASGKSTFAMRMQGPFVVIDADHRIDEVAQLTTEDIYPVSEIGVEHTEPHAIAKRLDENMPQTRVGTILVDSLTTIIAPRVTNAINAKAEGELGNLYAGFKDKALAMRELQDAVTKWDTDVLWVYHLDDAFDAQGKEHTKATISPRELVRLTRSINMQLEVVVDEKAHKRGIKIVWTRRGRSDITLWDDSGVWKNMPEKIEAAAYDGLTQADMERIELSAPETFPSPAVAVAWAVTQGAFENETHAANAYDKVKREANPKSAREMTALWIADVQHRISEKTNGGAGR